MPFIDSHISPSLSNKCLRPSTSSFTFPLERDVEKRQCGVTSGVSGCGDDVNEVVDEVGVFSEIVGVCLSTTTSE